MLSIASNLVLSSIKSTTVAAVSKVESSTNPKLQLLMSTAISQDSEGVGSAQTQDNEEWTPIEKAIEDVLQVRVCKHRGFYFTLCLSAPGAHFA